MLPDFLIPNGVIRIDKVLEVLSRNPETVKIDKACSIFGCIDTRTAVKYINRAKAAIKQASLSLAEKLSHFPEKTFNILFTPGTPDLYRFQSLVTKFNELVIFLRGGKGYEAARSPCAFIGANWNKNNSKKSTTYASDSLETPDTS